MADALQTVLIIVYLICWPFVKLARAIAFALSPFWAIGQFILLPAIYLIRVILNILLFPFRLQLLDRVEV
jgi:hypothetical protein